jgi:hypothetical protein
MKYTTKNDLKQCQCLFLNILSVLYSNNGAFGLHLPILELELQQPEIPLSKIGHAPSQVPHVRCPAVYMCVTATTLNLGTLTIDTVIQ